MSEVNWLQLNQLDVYGMSERVVDIPFPKGWPAGALHRHAVGTWLQDQLGENFPPSKIVAVMVVGGEVMYDILQYGQHRTRRVTRQYVDWLKPLTAVDVRNIMQRVHRERRQRTRRNSAPAGNGMTP